MSVHFQLFLRPSRMLLHSCVIFYFPKKVQFYFGETHILTKFK